MSESEYVEDQGAEERLEKDLDEFSQLELGGAAHLDFQEKLRKRVPIAAVTILLIAINLLVFLVMLAAGVHPIEPTIASLLEWGANYGPKTTGGEWWRLFTSNYLHIGIIHILFNMVVLWVVGPLVERLLGHLQFFIIYTVSGILGACATVVFLPEGTSAGASGAIFGIYGCLLGLLLTNHAKIPKEVVASQAKSALFFVGYNVLFGFSAENVDMAAHGGGLVAGFVLGLIAVPLGNSQASRIFLRPLLVGLAGIGLAVAFVPNAGPDILGNFEGLTIHRFGAGNEIYYGKGASKKDAERLAAQLEESGFLTGGPKSLSITHPGDNWVLSVVIMEEFREDPEVRKGLRAWANIVSEEAFDGEPLDLRLVDDEFTEFALLGPDAEAADAESDAIAYRPKMMLGVGMENFVSSPLFAEFREPFVAYLVEDEDPEGEAEARQLVEFFLSEISVITSEFMPDNQVVVTIYGLDRENFEEVLQADGIGVTNDGRFATLQEGEQSVSVAWLGDEAFCFGVQLGDETQVMSRESFEPMLEMRNETLDRARTELESSRAFWVSVTGVSEESSDEAIAATLSMVADETLSIHLEIRKDVRADILHQLLAMVKEQSAAIPSAAAFLATFKAMETEEASSYSLEMSADELRTLIRVLSADPAFMAVWALLN